MIRDITTAEDVCPPLRTSAIALVLITDTVNGEASAKKSWMSWIRVT